MDQPTFATTVLLKPETKTGRIALLVAGPSSTCLSGLLVKHIWPGESFLVLEHPQLLGVRVGIPRLGNPGSWAWPWWALSCGHRGCRTEPREGSAAAFDAWVMAGPSPLSACSFPQGAAQKGIPVDPTPSLSP